MKVEGTVLLAGLSGEFAEKASHQLLVAGASVLMARDEEAALRYLMTSMPRAMIVSSHLNSTEVRRVARARGVHVLESGPEFNPDLVTHAIQLCWS